jgi:D-alanyl-D-alanine carboxypeptidase
MPARRTSLPFIVVLMVALGIAAPAGAAAKPAPLPKPDRSAVTALVRQAMADERIPGVNVGVWIPGRGTYVRAFGTANRRTGAALRLRDHVRIASITKTFVATAALELVDHGRLRLSDHLARFVRGIPNGRKITVRQLLGMTAGVYDYTMDAGFTRRLDRNPLLPFGPRDAIAIIRRHRPNFAPGLRVEYSDSNYMLLGLIIEKVTHRPLARVIRRRVLAPLRLGHTSFPATPAIPSPFARGYYAGADGKGRLRDVTAFNPGVAGAAGAMISTLGDLHRWAKALATGTLLRTTTQKQRLRFRTIPNPGGPAVGYGLGIFTIAGFIGHNGAIFGYNTAAFYLPEARATIVVEANKSTNFSSEALDIFVGIAKRLFPERFPPPAP